MVETLIAAAEQVEFGVASTISLSSPSNSKLSRRALDELHVEDDAGHGMHTGGPDDSDLEERPRRPVPPGAAAPSALACRLRRREPRPRGTRATPPAETRSRQGPFAG